MEHPINRVEWVPVEDLSANDYNPNMVFTPELRLLTLSLLSTGWMQPILVTQDGRIIDGFHRWRLASDEPKVRALTAGRVPVCRLELSEPERMMLTVRINRAKGSHVALKMADLAKALVNDYGLSIDSVAKGIGATRQEVELLLAEGVFKAMKVADHKYSQAWYPK